MKLTHIPILILLFLLGIFTVSLYQTDIAQNKTPKFSKILGQDFPEFRLKTHDGGSFDNADLRGKYSVINIFASWCLTCKFEHKNLVFMSQNNIDVYGINWRDEPPKLEKYLRNLTNPYRKIGLDPKGELVIQLGTRGIPETFVVNPAGKIVFYHAGLFDREMVIKLAGQIKAGTL